MVQKTDAKGKLSSEIIPLTITVSTADSLSGYLVGITGEGIVPTTDATGKLSYQVIPTSEITVATAESAINADTVDGYHATTEVRVGILKPLNNNSQFEMSATTASTDDAGSLILASNGGAGTAITARTISGIGLNAIAGAGTGVNSVGFIGMASSGITGLLVNAVALSTIEGKGLDINVLALGASGVSAKGANIGVYGVFNSGTGLNLRVIGGNPVGSIEGISMNISSLANSATGIRARLSTSSEISTGAKNFTGASIEVTPTLGSGLGNSNIVGVYAKATAEGNTTSISNANIYGGYFKAGGDKSYGLYAEGTKYGVYAKANGSTPAISAEAAGITAITSTKNIEILDRNSGLVLYDRATGTRYKVFINNGVLGVETF